MTDLYSRLVFGLAYGIVFLGALFLGGWPLWVVLTFLAIVSGREAFGLFSGQPLVLFLGCFDVVGFGFGALAIIRASFGASVSLGFLIAAFVFDTASYLGGRAIGGPRLIPHISPNKTRSGALVGLGALLLLAPWLLPSFSPALAYLVASLLACLFLAGDLLVSVFKRRAGLKDTGQILGAHGGILDRVDSLLLATPAYGLMLFWAG